ncbi:MAG: hypothetical protein G01um101416_237 [Microgenomates group bacterium Gr01-1014_16]|nr:MAG: hypothetical protein G01um101416_237 [Microgenomates group bacterium Gr01-1014_16]
MRREASGPAAAKAMAGEVNSNSNRSDKITFIMRLKIIVALLLVVGVGFSVWDYKSWRREEIREYGKGPKINVQSSMFNVQLTEIYQNDELGIRLKYPADWEIEKNLKIEKSGKNLPDLVDEEVARLGKLDREPDHVSTNVTVLTKDGNQTALTKKGDVFIKIISPMEGLAGEIAKSLVSF